MTIELIIQIATMVGVGQIVLLIAQKIFSRKKDSVDLLKEATGSSIQLYEKQIDVLNRSIKELQLALDELKKEVSTLDNNIYTYKFALRILTMQLIKAEIKPEIEYNEIDEISFDDLHELGMKYGIVLM